MDVIGALVAGHAQFGWSAVTSMHEDNELTLYVTSDAIKFDGVRRSASAKTLQQAADLLGAMLMTPKVVDLVWMQAKTRINSIVRVNGDIAANSTDEVLSAKIDAEIKKIGDKGGIIDSIGKYWVLMNRLVTMVQLHPYKERGACNYGWPGTDARLQGVSKGVLVWQTPGFRHNDEHVDPSQVMRVMYRKAVLRQGSKPVRVIDLHEVGSSPDLAPLISHEGVLRCLRQPSVPAQAGDVVLTNYHPPLLYSAQS